MVRGGAMAAGQLGASAGGSVTDRSLVRLLGAPLVVIAKANVSPVRSLSRRIACSRGWP